MQPLLVLISVVAVASAQNGGFGGGGGFNGGGGGGYSGNRGGYSGGGGGGFSGGGHNGVGHNGGGHGGGGGFSGAGGFSGGGGGGGGFGSGYNSGATFSAGGNGNDHHAGNFGGGGQIRKFVSVHVGPEEPQFTQTKVIRAGGAPDKHVNIIFVKAPSAASQQNTEVILPEAPKQKTLVYVLIKKQESNSNVRVRGPAPTRPSKPEVYFIRYKDNVGHPAGPGGFGGDVGVGGGATPAFVPPQSVGPVSGGY